MKKHFSKILFFIVIMIFISPLTAKANFGDLRYEVTEVNISGSNITFKGWAFIHRTNNFTTVEYSDGTKNTDGGQKILMRAYDNGNLIDTVVVDGSSSPNYNFYCELFFKDENIKCTEDNYKKKSTNNDYKTSSDNNCKNDSSGNGLGFSQCYYEDMAFNITFDTSKWNVSENSNITFKIAVSNNDFESKLGSNKSNYLNVGDDYYTEPEDVSVASASVSNLENDYIVINKDKLATKVEFIAKTGILLNNSTNINQNERFIYADSGVKCTYGAWKNGINSYETCGSNIYELIEIDNYSKGRSNTASTCQCEEKNCFLGTDCKGTNNFAIKVDKDYRNNGYVCSFACPNNSTNSSDYKIAIARGSHVKPVGTFSIKVKNDKKCDVTVPSSGALECNKSKTFDSTCNELTVRTDKGSAVVKIEQSGTVSSILTPSRIYAGGGFNLGILYYNTIKWSYANGIPSSQDLRNAVEEQMQRKIKDYDTYIAGLKITELKLDGKSYDDSFLVKKCSTNSTNDKYYNKELTVSCVFYFPESTILQNGNVSYKYGAVGEGISNKFYTDINDNGNFKIEARISGMDRITSNSSKSDSRDNTKGWTGDWSDTFENCTIEVYPLLVCPDCSSNGDMTYKFIYRPIDIYNPFPNRNPGINWFEWYNIEKNKDRLENTYSELQYVANLDNKAIADIKKYNKEHNYLDWDSIDENTEKSSFITNNDYIVRGGGNQ